MAYITFNKKHSARTGNLFFQYLFTKIICIATNHVYKYIPLEEWQQYVIMNEIESNQVMHITDANSNTIIQSLFQMNSQEEQETETKENISQIFSSKHIFCDGYFQQSDFYIPLRDRLIEILYQDSNTDYWIQENGNLFSIFSFLTHSSHILFQEHEQNQNQIQTQTQTQEIVLNLRLDDFIQLPCPTSDILPPSYYLSILDSIGPSNIHKIWIVCDTIRHAWEKKYLEYFEHYCEKYAIEIILLQNTLTEDCATMRDCPILIHSNSTLCWIMSFLSRNPKKRYIPNTLFYPSQSLKMIELTDSYYIVKPLLHQEVYQLQSVSVSDSFSNIYSLPYSIPDECIVSTEQALSAKKYEIAYVNPSDRTTYIYGPGQQEEYYQMYRESRFAYTCKKGGWDCLRHYEIMANGCIPIFTGLEKCPEKTLCTFPKELLLHAYTELLPWEETAEKKMKYAFYLSKMMENMREYGTVSKMAEYVLNTMSIYCSPENPIRNILLIPGNVGVNYTRELTWIGIKRYIQSVGGVAVEYPKMDFLYESFPVEKTKELYGFGYTYSRRLTEEKDGKVLEDTEIVEWIRQKKFDLIIYGKMGPDEGWQGTIPHSPLWELVSSVYSKNQIVFLFGGDECFDMKKDSISDNTYKYKSHLTEHAKKGHCFVRELQ
jgi:hypothetical protein